jgi:DMSO reductase family type II enzyme heme b subunit
MLVKRVAAASKNLLDPNAAEWQEAPLETIATAATPIANQPNDYLKISWQGRQFGVVTELRVRALHNGMRIFFRLEWDDPIPNYRVTDDTVFTDGAGILFPLRGDADVTTMGSVDQPVNAWFWRADFDDQPKNVTAGGVGTSQRLDGGSLSAKSQWADGVWRLVIGRPFSVPESADEAVPLEPGKKVKVGFAVLEGSVGERAGFKAFSQEWRELEIES